MLKWRLHTTEPSNDIGHRYIEYHPRRRASDPDRVIISDAVADADQPGGYLTLFINHS